MGVPSNYLNGRRHSSGFAAEVTADGPAKTSFNKPGELCFQFQDSSGIFTVKRIRHDEPRCHPFHHGVPQTNIDDSWGEEELTLPGAEASFTPRPVDAIFMDNQSPCSTRVFGTTHPTLPVTGIMHEALSACEPWLKHIDLAAKHCTALSTTLNRLLSQPLAFERHQCAPQGRCLHEDWHAEHARQVARLSRFLQNFLRELRPALGQIPKKFTMSELETKLAKCDMDFQSCDRRIRRSWDILEFAVKTILEAAEATVAAAELTIHGAVRASEATAKAANATLDAATATVNAAQADLNKNQEHLDELRCQHEVISREFQATKSR
ncbi:hypothetical protein K438DRAFT_1984106 [Mycena galopus ATCC 62051]|nr:hypothetical protein K438DRAFT_1984106 [Mycena galopus ATCC 62051]